jgi:hypothetical protein
MNCGEVARLKFALSGVVFAKFSAG